MDFQDILISLVRQPKQSTIHAEQNCISDCANRGVSTKGAIAILPIIHVFIVVNY